MTPKQKETQKVTNEFIGERIQDLLTKRNLTHDSLAKILNIDRASLTRYILGQRSVNPSFLIQISKALDCTPDYLLGFSQTLNSTTPEIQDICDYTGLTEKSVENLHDLTNLFDAVSPFNPGETVNLFLESGAFNHICFWLHEKIRTIKDICLQIEKGEENDEGLVSDYNEMLNRFELLEYRAHKCFSAFVANHNEKIVEKYQKPLEKKYDKAQRKFFEDMDKADQAFFAAMHTKEGKKDGDSE